MFESSQLIVLCSSSALFIVWVISLKREIVDLLTESQQLKQTIKQRAIKETRDTVILSGPQSWSYRSF
jgi:hypothetical protein